jgi:hypothetical protein
MGQVGAQRGPNQPVFSKSYVLELNTVLVFDLYNYGICKQC